MEKFRYTLQTMFMGKPHEEECFIRKDEFYPFGVVKEGHKLRGEFGFMQVHKVYEEPNIKYGKFIAKSISYEEMNSHKLDENNQNKTTRGE
jgi:hypothetical protein